MKRWQYPAKVESFAVPTPPPTDWMRQPAVPRGVPNLTAVIASTVGSVQFVEPPAAAPDLTPRQSDIPVRSVPRPIHTSTPPVEFGVPVPPSDGWGQRWPGPITPPPVPPTVMQPVEFAAPEVPSVPTSQRWPDPLKPPPVRHTTTPPVDFGVPVPPADPFIQRWPGPIFIPPEPIPTWTQPVEFPAPPPAAPDLTPQPIQTPKLPPRQPIHTWTQPVEFEAALPPSAPTMQRWPGPTFIPPEPIQSPTQPVEFLITVPTAMHHKMDLPIHIYRVPPAPRTSWPRTDFGAVVAPGILDVPQHKQSLPVWDKPRWQWLYPPLMPFGNETQIPPKLFVHGLTQRVLFHRGREDDVVVTAAELEQDVFFHRGNERDVLFHLE